MKFVANVRTNSFVIVSSSQINEITNFKKFVANVITNSFVIVSSSQINESLKFHFIFKQSMKVQMMLHKRFDSIVACDVGQKREGVGPPCLEAWDSPTFLSLVLG